MIKWQVEVINTIMLGRTNVKGFDWNTWKKIMERNRSRIKLKLSEKY